jgi:hypothetical protein
MNMMRPEDLLNSIDQQRDVVPDAPLAELPEIGEIPAYLRGIYLGQLGKPSRRHRLRPLSTKVEEYVQIGW